MRFLFALQHVGANSRLSGEAALAAVLERLACFEAPAQAWEADLLPARSTRPGSTAFACRARRYGDGAYPTRPEGAEATLQNRVELHILYPMNSEDPDPYTRSRSAY
jgi:hypothetical protein